MAMTQKTVALLLWSSWHLTWADHVLKVVKRGVNRGVKGGCLRGELLLIFDTQEEY